ncbi:MAG: ABC transporter permease subunit [Dehalococcoidia bacterium]|nr:ABC transporter permease subunit [Dehalococcoidia bacterium]MYA53390.1 ABC transporter permease subunit [Dehalococcoidia bacterium]
MSERAAGSIFDLGYRRYEGRRLGRRDAVLALYVHGLRASFGLGRRTRSKIFPIGLAIVAAVPAVVQIMIASLGAEGLDIFRAEDYYFYIEIILVLFVAVIAPELLGRDERHATLSLYFSRGLSRSEYAWARYGAMATALLALTLLPQAIMFLGNALVGDSFTGYFKDEWRQIGPIVAAGVLISLFLASIGLIIAAQTPRRAFATVGILAPFLLLTFISSALVSNIDNIVGRLGIFLNPLAVMDGFTRWLFNAESDGGPLMEAAFAGGWYFAFALALATIAVALLLRHYQRRSL